MELSIAIWEIPDHATFEKNSIYWVGYRQDLGFSLALCTLANLDHLRLL